MVSTATITAAAAASQTRIQLSVLRRVMNPTPLFRFHCAPQVIFKRGMVFAINQNRAGYIPPRGFFSASSPKPRRFQFGKPRLHIIERAC
jgi:hypothetical protein